MGFGRYQTKAVKISDLVILNERSQLTEIGLCKELHLTYSMK